MMFKISNEKKISKKRVDYKNFGFFKPIKKNEKNGRTWSIVPQTRKKFAPIIYCVNIVSFECVFCFLDSKTHGALCFYIIVNKREL